MQVDDFRQTEEEKKKAVWLPLLEGRGGRGGGVGITYEHLQTLVGCFVYKLSAAISGRAVKVCGGWTTSWRCVEKFLRHVPKKKKKSTLLPWSQRADGEPSDVKNEIE